jgi:hypothetical protein
MALSTPTPSTLGILMSNRSNSGASLFRPAYAPWPRM